jgi:hypothetical protein
MRLMVGLNRKERLPMDPELMIILVLLTFIIGFVLGVMMGRPRIPPYRW